MLKKSGLRWLWIAVLIIIIDRLAKSWVLKSLVPNEPVSLLPVFNLTLAYNKGAAFSFLSGASGWQNFFLGGLAAVVSVILLVWLSRITSKEWWLSIALCLVLGGALGNAWDRLLYGYVIDFFGFHLGNWHFAIFNTADSFICVGAAMLFVSWMREKRSVSF